MPQKQDHASEYLEKLFEKVKAKVEAIKAAGSGTTNACDIPASTPDKAYSVEKTAGNRERDCIFDLLIISQGAQVTPEADPLLVRNIQDIKELSYCKEILKEYADKINVEKPNYETADKVNGSKLAFVSSINFNGKKYVGDEGRNKKESQRLAARAVILSILDSDAREVISKIIKSKEKMLFPAKGKVHNPCSSKNVGMSAGIQTGCDVGTSSIKGNELKVVVNDNMLETATQDPCIGNLSGVSAKPVSFDQNLSFCKAILKEYADKINVKNPTYKTEKADGLRIYFSSLTFNGKQYIGDKARNKKRSQDLAACTVIRSILDSDAHDVIAKIIMSKEMMMCPAKGKVHNPCNTQNVSFPVGIQTGYNVGTSSRKGNELKVVVNDNLLKRASQEPCTGSSSTVTAKPVSLVEASVTITLIAPSNSEPLVVEPTTSKKRKRKTKKAEHKVGIDAQVQSAAVPSSQTITSTDYSDRICAPNNCTSLPGSDNAVLTS